MKLKVSVILAIIFYNFFIISFSYASDQNVAIKSNSSNEFKVAGAKVLFFISLVAIGSILIKRTKSRYENGKSSSQCFEILSQQIINGGTRISLVQALGKSFIVATSTSGSISMLSLEENNSRTYDNKAINDLELKREYFNA